MKKIVTLAIISMLLIIVSNDAQAQTPQFFNANNSNSNNNWPLNAASQINNRCQWNYGPSLFSSLGGGLGVPAYAGLITDVYFRMGNNVNATSLYNIDMAIGQNVGTQTSFVNGTYVAGLTPILANSSYALTGVTAFAWYRVTLPTPILYNPAASLVFEIYQAGTGGGNLLSQNTSLPGNRIYGGQAAAGGVLGNGLVDFGFDLIPNTPCTGMPTAGTTTGPANPCPGVLSTYFLTGATLASGLTYQWISSTVSCTGPWNIMLNDTNSSMSTFPPVGMTTYYRCVVTCTSSMLSDTSTCLAVTPQLWSPYSPCYCYNSVPTATNDENIGQVTVGAFQNPTPPPPQINNPAATAQYSNFDNLTMPCYIQGQTYPISVLQTGTFGGNSTSWVKSWIDYNHNTSWADPGEEIFSQQSNFGNTFNPAGTFTIPTNALPGLTRMRFVLREFGNATTTMPCGTYPDGETEDYVICILAAGPHDPAVTNIQAFPNAGCMDSCETVLLTLSNFGSAVLDLSVNNLIVTLNVTGPSGTTSYIDTVTAGFLNPFNTNSTFLQFPCVNFYEGGCYSINTDTLTVLGSTNTNLVNDSLFAPLVICNSRPNNGGDYTLCLGDTIPTGLGLSIINCPTGLVQDSVLIPFTIGFAGNTPPSPTQCVALGGGAFASGTMPNLPNGANILNGEISANNLQVAPLTFTTNPTFARISLHQGPLPTTAANIFHNGIQGSAVTSSFGCFNYLSNPSGIDLNNMYNANGTPVAATVNMGHWAPNRCTTPTILTNCGGTTVVYLKLVYEYIPMGISWYEQPSGGIRISDSSVLDPLNTTNTIVSTSNNLGTYTFYGACAADTNCRVAVDMIVAGLTWDSVVVSNVLCNGDSTGSVLSNVLGGTVPYTYTLTGPINPPTNATGAFTNLPAGNYTLSVIDGVGCGSGDSTFTITEPAAIVIDTALVTNVLCYGDTSGTIYVHAQGPASISYQNIPNPAQASGSFTGLGAATYTIRASHSSGACFVDTLLTVNQPISAVGFTGATVSDVSCNGVCDGSLTVTGGGGMPGYNYRITLPTPVGPNATGNFTSLCAGNYTVRITDTNGCTHDTILTVTEPAVLSISSLNTTNVLCYGNTTGQLVMTASGGTQPMQGYTILPVATQSPAGTFTGLGSGTYTVTGTDANGCTAVTTITITQPVNAVSITNITSTQPSCVPGGDATMTVTASGGTVGTGYSYFNGTPPAQASNVFTYQGAGNYTVTVTDGNGCTAQSTHTISTPGAPTWNVVTANDALCNGDSSGSFSATVTAGTSPTITLSITAPAAWAQSPITSPMTGLPAGSYTIQAADANGCSITSVVIINEPTILAIDTTSVLDVDCYGNSTGQIVMTYTGGMGTVTYSTPAPGSQTTAGTITGLPWGTYTITGTDGNGCTASTNVTITQPTVLSYTSITTNNVTCNGAADGSITALGTGGTAPLSFTLLPTVAPTIPPSTFGNLGGGNQTVRITDGNGCTLDSVVTISEPTLLVIDTVSTTPILCYGDSTGQIVMMRTGGTPNVTYTISPALGNQSPIGDSTINNLPAGIYTITATDNNSCTATRSVTITQPATAVNITAITGTTPSCTPGNDGTITVTASGGTGTLVACLPPNLTPTYPLTGPITGLGSGSYIVRVKDANGCFADTNFTITNSSAPTIDSATSVIAQCNGDSTGSMIVYATGNPQASVTYAITAPAAFVTIPQNPGAFTNLPAGTYTVTVRDANNCPVSTAVVITEPTAVVYSSVSTTNVSCNGGSDGGITVTGTGGTGMFTATPVNTGSSPTFTFGSLSAGTTTVQLTDGNGCTADSMIVVSEPTAVMVDTAWSVDVLCNGDSNGGITVQSSGGTGSIYHVIGTDTILSNPAVFANYGSGMYTITSVDANACTSSTTVTVNQPAPLSHSYTSTNVTCFGACDGSITFTGSGGIAPYGYTLFPPNTSNITGGFTGLCAGTNYQGIITDSNGCVDSSVLITITQPTQVVFTSLTKQDIDCFGQSTGSISASASGGTLPDSISIPGRPRQASPATFNNVAAGIYIVTATDANGCSATASITVIENPQIFFSSITNIEETCYGDGTAAITFQAAGGVGGFNYIFDVTGTPQGPSAQTTYSGLSTGTYVIRATDNLGCTYDSSYTLIGPDRINFPTFIITATSCLDTEDGKLIVVAAGGRGSVYNYSLEPGFYINTSGIFRDLAPRQYTLRTTDTAGCFIDTVFDILLPSNPMLVSITKEDLGCLGRGNEGKANAVVTGGTPPYTYLWNSIPAQTTSRATALYQGFHTVDVVDANGCLERDTVIIEPGPCCQEVFLPNAFSPNNDGRNDEFRILSTAGIELQQFEVRNRWGIKIWEASNTRSSWDGIYGGEAVNVGTYYYVLRYKCLTDGQDYTMKGDVILVR